MYTLDASVFTSTIDPTAPGYTDCATLLEQLRDDDAPIFIPALLLTEVAGAISRARGDSMRAHVFVAALHTMPNLSIVALDDGLAQRATDLAADYWLRGVDAVYVAVAQQFDTTLVTLDPEQGRRAAEVVPVRSPGQLIAGMVRLLT